MHIILVLTTPIATKIYVAVRESHKILVRAITVRSRVDLNNLARELSKNFTVVFNDDDNFLTMREGLVVKRFRVRRQVSEVREPSSRLPESGHVLLLARDAASGVRQESRFLSEGLSRGERSVYATHQKVSLVERQMAENGIDAKRFENKGLLHIMELSDPFQEKAGYVVGVGKIIDRIMKANPARIVSWRWIRDISNSEQNAANREVERSVDSAMRGDILGPAYASLGGFQGLLVCTYAFSQIGTRVNWDWLVNHFSHHDSTILANQDGMTVFSR